MGPGALIVSPCGVEHATLAMRPHPGPWFSLTAFGLFTFDTVFQNSSVFFVMQVMDVCFIPARESAEAIHDRMSRLSNLCRKHPSAMSLKLGSHQFDDVFIIAPAIRRAMERDE